MGDAAISPMDVILLVSKSKATFTMLVVGTGTFRYAASDLQDVVSLSWFAAQSTLLLSTRCISTQNDRKHMRRLAFKVCLVCVIPIHKFCRACLLLSGGKVPPLWGCDRCRNRILKCGLRLTIRNSLELCGWKTSPILQYQKPGWVGCWHTVNVWLESACRRLYQ